MLAAMLFVFAASALPAGAQADGLRVVDGAAFPRTAQGIQAAIDSLHGAPGAITLTPGTYELQKEILVSGTGVRISGFGFATRLRVTSPSANVFRVTGELFELTDVTLETPLRKSAGSIILAENGQGALRRVRIDGDFFNGFTLDADAADNWTFEEIRVIGGHTWNYLIHLTSPRGTVASTHIRNFYVSNATHWKTASIVLDSGVDTFVCSDSELGPVLLQDSQHRLAPRWVRFTNTLIEAGYNGTVEGVGLRIDAGRDVRYQGYFATSDIGVAAGPNALSVDVSHTEFVNIGQSAVTIAKGARDVRVADSSFDEIGVRVAGRNAIDVAPGAGSFILTNNFFHAKNHSAHAIHVPPDAGQHSMSGNAAERDSGQMILDETQRTGPAEPK